MNKIRKGDNVIVTTGKDKGRTGTVSRVLDDRLLIDGVNLVKKHVKPNPNKGEEGGIKSFEASVHISNVMLVNPSTGKGGRVRIETQNGEKVRVFKSDGSKVAA